MVILPSGKEIKFDFGAITISEYRGLFEDHPVDSDDDILSRVSGLTVDELRALSYKDYRALVKAFFEAARDPLADPN